jgi:hypothetical protein
MAGAAGMQLPPDDIEAATGSLGAAVALADQIQGPVSSGLAATAREAFVQGLQFVSLLATCTMVVTAVVFSLALHANARSGSHSN